MTTTVEKSVNLRWDSFLEGDVPGDAPGRAKPSRTLRQMIEAYRQQEWPNIKRDLQQQFNWVIPDDLEPHWVAPGRAVLWQEQVISKRVEEPDEQGIPRRKLVPESAGWHPTTLGVPFNNASQVAQFLQRGFRLRPPTGDAGVEAYMKSASLSEEPTAEPIEPPQYVCGRPHAGRFSDPVGFFSWKAYTRHCMRHQEMPEYDPPAEVLEAMRGYIFWCHAHNRGYKSERLALRHVREELRKPGRNNHVSLEQMKVSKGAS